MGRSNLGQMCAGCRDNEFARYPLIKVPAGEVDDSRFPAIAVNYYLYCYKCVQAMIIPPRPPRKWWQFWRWLEKPDEIDIWREERGLKPLSEEDLERIYA